MKKSIFSATILAASVALVGCGGGGGSNTKAVDNTLNITKGQAATIVEPSSSYTFSNGKKITNSGTGTKDSTNGIAHFEETRERMKGFLTDDYTGVYLDNNDNGKYDDGEYYIAFDGGKVGNAVSNKIKIGLKLSNDEIYEKLNVHGLVDAHKQGWTGKDVTVVIHDIDTWEGKEGHGIDVYYTAASFAPGADLLYDGNQYNSDNDQGQIHNHSYEVSQTMIDHHLYWDGDALHTWAAGNSSEAMISYDDVDNIIFVGALSGDSTLATYSNTAGKMANHFIVTDEKCLSESKGTSCAAPKVSGAAALVIHKFETNTDNTKKILLMTADDLGDKGVDSTFGYGRLNVERALSPVGDLK